MKKFKDLPLKEKLITITTVTALVSMILVLTVNLLSAYIGFKHNIRGHLTSFSRIIGANCKNAVLTGDSNAANKTLETLKAEPRITYAGIYLSDGTLFAEYTRKDDGNVKTPIHKNIYREYGIGDIPSDEFNKDDFVYDKGNIIIFEPVLVDGSLIGVLAVESDHKQLQDIMGGILFVNLCILITAFIIAVIIASKAQKAISIPVNTLADTISMVSKDKDYSVRIKKQSKDELGTLFTMFNEMLSEIQTRDDRLQFAQYTIDHMQDAIIWTDSKARIVKSNNKACELLGYTKEEILTVTLYNLYPMLTPATWQESWEFITREKNINAEMKTLRKDGTSFPSEVFVSNIAFNGREYNCSFIRDITERKKLESKLEQAQKMEAIGTLAGGVAHDLNNILGGLVGYPDLLLMDLPQGSPLETPLKTIKKSGEKAAAIVQDLLTLARRNIDIQVPLNLNDVIADYLKSPEHLKIMEFHPDVEIHTDLEENLPNIMGSDAHLSKVIMNLVSNAAESMNEIKGPVYISTGTAFLDTDYHGFQDIIRGKYVIMSVEDRGVGITEEEKKNIFEPFYTKKIMGRSGTGLGMTVVSGVVKDHAGFIDLESTRGKGSRFDLYFPITEERIRPRDRDNAFDSCRGIEKILVVDDVEEQRELASYALKKLGYSVDTAVSGEKALRQLKIKGYDLVILDMIMAPGMDGLDTYRDIIKIIPDQKTIIASGFAENSRVREALNLGAGSYVKKPYTVNRLGRAVRAELDK